MLFSLPTLRTSIAGKARSYTSNATATLTRNNANRAARVAHDDGVVPAPPVTASAQIALVAAGPRIGCMCVTGRR